MPTISRTHIFTNGTTADATQLETEINTIHSAINGGLDNDNIAAGAGIVSTKLAEVPMSKVGDYAGDATEYATIFGPGDTASPSYPTALDQEIWRLRAKATYNKGYSTSAKYMDSAAVAQNASWVEPRIVGPNLLPNPGFEAHTAGTPNAPNGWSLLSTPSTVALENPAHTAVGLEKRSLNIVTDGATEGIQITVGGLKTGVKYLVGIAYSLTAGTINLVTTNGLATGDYRNLALTDASAASGTVEYLQGIVKPTATPASMTIQIYGTASGADFNLHSVWMYELQDGLPFEIPSIPTLTATDTSAANIPAAGWTGTGGTWRTETQTALSLTQYVPYPGYRMIYEVTFPFRSVNASDEAMLAYGAIQVNIDGGGASTVSGPVFFEGHAVSSNGTFGGTFSLRHVIDNPTPGSSYAFTFLVGVYDNDDYAQMSAPPSVNAVQMEARSRLIMEKL